MVSKEEEIEPAILLRVKFEKKKWIKGNEATGFIFIRKKLPLPEKC
jgi:hypothetical protein